MSFLLQRILNRVSPVSLETAALSARIIAPAEELSDRPSIYVPGEFEAIIGVVHGNRALEWKRVCGAARDHRPTIEYVLKNARIRGCRLASGRFVQHFATIQPHDMRDLTELDDAILSTNALSGHEFGHWARDSLVVELHGAAAHLPAVGIARQLWPHEPGFRQLSGLDCHYSSDCRIQRLVLLDDRGHNSHWRRRFLELRDRMRGSVAAMTGDSAGPLVFLSRGTGGRLRDPSNLGPLRGLLETLGFQTVVPSELSPADIGVKLRDARVVVSAEGSHLNHLHFFAPDGPALITLQDPRRFYAYHKGLVDLYGGLFSFVVGRPDPNAPETFTIDPDTLRRTLDLVDSALPIRA